MAEPDTEGVTTGTAVPVHQLARDPVPVDTTIAADLPERLRYRIKRRLLGPPLVSDELEGQHLGKPTALAVLSSDVMSSSAYASEQMLRILVPVGGLAAFTLVTPITGVILCVLAVVTICYRDVVRSYPKAGGSYVVSRDNFGPNVAQIAGAALLISYTITVAVSVAAGADAILSAFPSLSRPHVALLLSVAFVVMLAYGNLRGIREAGRVFALPTYFFIANMAVLIVLGLVREITTGLPHAPPSSATMPLGHASGGLILGFSAFYLLKSFANGSSAMTGTEAISNSVSIFKPPQTRNARTTLVLMSTILGAMFLGVSLLASFTHTLPFRSGTPTVLSEIGTLVYGTSTGGRVLYFVLQAATALILVLAANTSFTGFPFLVSFVAEDSFLPRMLTVRGHRLVYSNGILVLAAASVALLLVTGARVSALIPMYAIAVFTGFTMAGAGMFKHYWIHRDPGWQRGVTINGIAAVVCAVVVVIFAVTEFRSGAWVVVVVMPLLVGLLVRTNRQYRSEDAVLEEGAAIVACEAPVLRRTVVVILVDRIDLATARAIQYARTLTPDDLRAVHFNIDHRRAEALIARWQRLGLSRLPLDVVDCPDRRLTRASLELAAEAADGDTEVNLLLPRRSYGRAWRRLLHDRTADQIVEVVSQLAHVNATIVPFVVAPGTDPAAALDVELAAGSGRSASSSASGRARPGAKAKARDWMAPPAGSRAGSEVEAPSGGSAGTPGGAKGPVATSGAGGERERKRRRAAARAAELSAEVGPRVPGTVPIDRLKWRSRVRVAGRVRSLRVLPWAQGQSLECVLVDGSGHAVTLVFLGRRSISGIHSGSLVAAEGMVGKHRDRLAIINPTYELLSVLEPDGR